MNKLLIILIFATNLFAQTFSGTHSGLKIDSVISGIFNDTVSVEWLYQAESIHLFHYFGDSTVTFSFAAGNTWYHLTNATQNLYTTLEDDGFTVSNDTITVLRAGDYDMYAKINYDGNNGVTQSVRYFNVTQTAGIPTAGGMTTRGADNFVNINVSAYAEFNAGDKVVLQMKQDNTTDCTLKSGTMKIFYLHD